MQNSTLVLESLEVMNENNVEFKGQCLNGIATKNSDTNIDLLLEDDCFITGGNLIVNNSVFGDYCKMQVIDIDNILGNGANFVVAQFVDKWMIRSDSQYQMEIVEKYPVKLIAGLYIRCIYTSIGTEIDPEVVVNFYTHLALY
jgi:hypothetical protein